MRYHDIDIDPARITAFCKRHRIVRLALFGSVIRDDFGPKSDVDVLVTFAPDAEVGFFGIAEMERELTEMLGRPIEIHTDKGLHPRYRDEVLRAAEVQYEQA